jgi:UDP-N-acetyl-D-glucosamine dehydrogenase
MAAEAPEDALITAGILEKIGSKTATVGIMGLGYVGLPLAATFHKAGFNVMGFDISPEKVEACQSGTSYLEHLPDSKGLFRRLADSSTFTATTDMARLNECDAVLICVPTPLTSHFEPDLSFVKTCGSLVAASIRKGQLIVLESTTYPGTTR